MLGNIYHLTIFLLRFIILHKTKTTPILTNLTITSLLFCILIIFFFFFIFSSSLTRHFSTLSYRCLESISLSYFLLNLLAFLTSLRIFISFSPLVGVLNSSFTIVCIYFFLFWSISLSLLRQPIIKSFLLIFLLF